MQYRPGPPLWLLVLVTFSGTLAMHMFVPALTTASRELGATSAEIQATISTYILGLAVGQLAYGPLSDRFGRRPTLLAGLALFTAAGAACMAASSVQVLVASRFAQAVGGCSGLLLGRAIVRDISSPEETMRRLALVSLMTLIGPGFAPLIGGLVVASLGWRWVFAVFVALGAAGFVLSWRLLPETRPAALAGRPVSIAAEYAELLRSPAFLGCVVGGGCATTAFYAFVAAAPFLFAERFHEPVTVVGVYLGLLIVGMSVGNVASGRLVRRMSLTRLVVVSNGLSVVCAFILLAQLTLLRPTAIGVVATMFVYCIGAGMCSPAVATKAMSVNPRVTGSASGIYGFVQMAIGAACTALVGFGHDHGLVAAGVLAGAGVLGQLAFAVAFRWSPAFVAQPQE